MCVWCVLNDRLAYHRVLHRAAAIHLLRPSLYPSLSLALSLSLSHTHTLSLTHTHTHSGNQRGATVMPDETFFDVPSDAMEKVVKLNFNGTILPTQIFGKLMAEARSGTVINISSMAAIQPLTRVCGYSASKAAIENLTRWLAVEFAQKYGDGVRVNAIAPGFFLAEQNRALLTNEDGSLTSRGQQIISATPMGRFGSAEELHGALIYLCSDASKFVTGTSMFVDGGFAAFSGV